MEIVLLTVGKTSQDFIKSGITEYMNRLRRYVSFKITELPDVKNTRSLSEDAQKEREGKLILDNISTSDCCILLDERGKMMGSLEFSVFLEKIMASGRKRAVFVVGGPYGFSNDVYSRADYKISLSKMTFTHEMVRLFFTEQIYRAFTILKGEPYHHE